MFQVLSEDGKGIVTTLLDLIEFASNNMDLNEYTVSTVINPTLLWLEMYDKVRLTSSQGYGILSGLC